MTYRVGDAVRWRRDDAGRVPAWSYFEGGAGGNIGDPAHPDILVRESELFARTCPGCGQYVDVGVVIRGGIIEKVCAFDTGLPDCDASLLGGAGQVTPRPE